MRLSSPDDKELAQVEDFSSTSPVSPTVTSPVLRTSTSFPSVHRALYAVQGQRLRQGADVDIANLLQLPQFYWNNWDQWSLSGMGMPGAQGGIDPSSLNQAGNTDSDLQPIWDLPAHDPPRASMPRGSETLYNTTLGPDEAPNQTAVTNALLRYMLEGSQGGILP